MQEKENNNFESHAIQHQKLQIEANIYEPRWPISYLQVDRRYCLPAEVLAGGQVELFTSTVLPTDTSVCGQLSPVHMEVGDRGVSKVTGYAPALAATTWWPHSKLWNLGNSITIKQLTRNS
ncbi:Uncharacterized protein Fot_55648 [Forsythia ovata]|uniref:Uncharacterized protein n=1 Tax=Forsythia ovata TaxID=205694 RepID=A0ABD1P5K9_9LAMI